MLVKFENFEFKIVDEKYLTVRCVPLEESHNRPSLVVKPEVRFWRTF